MLLITWFRALHAWYKCDIMIQAMCGIMIQNMNVRYHEPRYKWGIQLKHQNYERHHLF